MPTTETPLEYTLTHTHKADMFAFMQQHPDSYEEAFKLAISNKQPYAWRAAWLLWSCLSKNDKRVRKHIPKILKAIPEKADGHQRELVKILSLMDLNEDAQGTLFDICLNLWKSIEKKPSVRYIAFQYLAKTAQQHPDLVTEIKYYTQKEYLVTLSPGVRRAINKLLTSLS